MEAKKQIRKEILDIRDSLEEEIRNKWNESIFSRLINSEFYKRARTIFIFVSFKSEVDTHKIIEYSIEKGKIICVPKIKSKQIGIEVFKIDSFKDLKEGYFNILEPVEGCISVDKNDIDLILMPGVAFDRHGGRIGYGGGFYDRFLSSMNKTADKIVLAYNFQVLDEVPMEENDVRVDGIITEEGIIYN